MTTFSALLTQLTDAQGKSFADIKRMLDEKNISVSYPALLSYKSGRIVPTFEIANMILSAFDYNMTYDELYEMLQYSRSQLRTINEDDHQYFQTSLRINPKNIDEDLNGSVLERILNERAEELFSDEKLAKEFKVGKRKLNAYITYLIKKDFKENYYGE